MKNHIINYLVLIIILSMAAPDWSFAADISTDKPEPTFFMLIAIIGAIIIKFRKVGSASSSWPAVATLSGFFIGICTMFYGLIPLFEKGHILLGIFTILIILIIFLSSIIFLLLTSVPLQTSAAESKSVRSTNHHCKNCNIWFTSDTPNCPECGTINNPD
jgi:hypothetical protein